MTKIKPKKLNIETISAIFIIALVSFFILANFATGFIFPLFLIIMSVAFLISIFYPRSGLYAIIFLTFIFERFFTLSPIILGREEYKLYPLDIIFLGVIGGIVFSWLSRKNPSSIPASPAGRLPLKKGGGILVTDYFLMAFIALAAIYFFFSAFILKSDFALAFSSFKNYAFYSLFYFAIIFLIKSKEDLKRFLKFALVGAIGIIFFIFYGILNGSGLWSEFTPLSTEGIRILAFTHAFYLCMAMIFSISWISFNERLSKYFLVLAIFGTIGIAGSMMRHLWLGLFISLIFLYFILPKENKLILKRAASKYFLIILTLFIIAFYAASLFPHSGLNKTSAEISSVIKNRIISTTNIYDESILWRNIVWKSVLKEYRENLVRGLGFGKKIFIEIDSYKDLVEIRNIHNSFIALLVQTGLGGIVIFLIFVWRLFKQAFDKIIVKDDFSAFRTAALTTLVFYLIVFMFQPYLEANLLGIFFWINMGILRIMHHPEYSEIK